jgi:hypothetical protein
MPTQLELPGFRLKRVLDLRWISSVTVISVLAALSYGPKLLHAEADAFPWKLMDLDRVLANPTTGKGPPVREFMTEQACRIEAEARVELVTPRNCNALACARHLYCINPYLSRVTHMPGTGPVEDFSKCPYRADCPQ